MSKLVIVGVIIVANMILAVVNALESGPVALTVTLITIGVFTQLMMIGMLASDARITKGDD